MPLNTKVLINDLKLRLRTEKNGIVDSLIRLGVQSSNDFNIFTSPLINVFAISGGTNQVFTISSATNLLTGYRYNPSADTYSLNVSLLGKPKTVEYPKLYTNMLTNDINNINAVWNLGYYCKTNSNITYAVLYTNYAIYSFKYTLDPSVTGGTITMIYIHPMLNTTNNQSLINKSIQTVMEYKNA